MTSSVANEDLRWKKEASNVECQILMDHLFASYKRHELASGWNDVMLAYYIRLRLEIFLARLQATVSTR